MKLIEICKAYFKAYERKDIQDLEEFFADDISLRDWNCEISGKKAVLHENQKVFKAVVRFKVSILKIHESDRTIFSELEMTIDDEPEFLKVIDVIEFDQNDKISAIRAYKG
jgi:hypothetical protein